MFDSPESRRNTLAMTIGWWYLRRLIRKRGAAAVAAFVAGEGISFARRPRERHPLRWLLALVVGAAAGYVWWLRRQDGGDDWGEWEPVAPVAPTPGDTVPAPPLQPVGT